MGTHPVCIACAATSKTRCCEVLPIAVAAVAGACPHLVFGGCILKLVLVLLRCRAGEGAAVEEVYSHLRGGDRRSS